MSVPHLENTMKRIILLAVVPFLAVACGHVSAAECWPRAANETARMPAASVSVLKKDGYACVDHRGTYVEVQHPDGSTGELVIPKRGLPRVKAQPAERQADLLYADLISLPTDTRRADAR